MYFLVWQSSRKEERSANAPILNLDCSIKWHTFIKNYDKEDGFYINLPFLVRDVSPSQSYVVYLLPGCCHCCFRDFDLINLINSVTTLIENFKSCCYNRLRKAFTKFYQRVGCLLLRGLKTLLQ